ncbi:MAG: transposase [Deltaproteobacteria bacterium]|nr:transposase [Deltaproteobacteria bacterium]
MWHHVMGRGLARGDIFVDAADREGFYELLVDARERWGLRTHAASLMDNHFHLLVEDTRGELGRAMRHVVGLHTQRFNRRHGRDGPLFRGRFRSRLVQHERYLAELVRYIHMNPVNARLVARAGDHAWTSHGHYLRGEAPAWLCTDEVLQRFDHDVLALDRFVHARLPAEVRERMDWSRHASIVGDEAFEAGWRERLRGELPVMRSATADVRRWLATDPAEVLAAVAAHFEVPTANLLSRRRGHTNRARQLAILVCVDHTPLTNRQLATALDTRASSLSPLATRYRRQLHDDPTFQADVDAVLQRLGATVPVRGLL